MLSVAYLCLNANVCNALASYAKHVKVERMDASTISKMTSSANQHWNTPNHILDPMYKRFDGIRLDPCSNSGSIVHATSSFSGPEIDKDGLQESWQCGGLVYVNPPYGRKIKPWVQKCVNEASLAKQAGNQTEIILLGPARTDTQFFQKLVCPTADSILLWEGRITFLGATGPALFPSFLAYWGHRPSEFQRAFTGQGWFITNQIL